MCSHCFRVADLDGDGKDEICMVLQQLMTMEVSCGAQETDMVTVYM